MSGSDLTSNNIRETEDVERNASLRSDSDDTCAICMNAVINTSTPDNCSHRFCYPCLQQWSTDHYRCPSCRQQYAAIRHNFAANGQFEVHRIDRGHDLNAIHDILQTVTDRMLEYVRTLQKRNELLEQRESVREEVRQTTLRLTDNENMSDELRAALMAHIQTGQRGLESAMAAIESTEAYALSLNPNGMETIERIIALILFPDERHSTYWTGNIEVYALSQSDSTSTLDSNSSSESLEQLLSISAESVSDTNGVLSSAGDVDAQSVNSSEAMIANTEQVVDSSANNEESGINESENGSEKSS